MAACNHSTSSSLSNETDTENEFHEALVHGAAGCPGSLSKLDYLDTLIAKRNEGCQHPYVARLTHDNEVRPYDEAFEAIVRSEQVALLPEVRGINLEQRRDFLHKQVLFIIGFHLVLLSMIDFSLQILLANCGSYCPAPTHLHHTELVVVISFPCSVLLFLRLLCCYRKSDCFNFVLLTTYSVTFSLFFFSVCDLVFGASKAHRDIALILFTLTISFILFSFYVYSKNSTTCLYFSLGILMLTVTLTFGVLLVFPATLNQLPHEIETILIPNNAPKKTSVWMAYVMAMIFAVASVSLTALMFIALRGIVFKRSNFDETTGPYSTAVNALLRTEMFFVVLPVELLCSACCKCLSRP